MSPDRVQVAIDLARATAEWCRQQERALRALAEHWEAVVDSYDNPLAVSSTAPKPLVVGVDREGGR